MGLTDADQTLKKAELLKEKVESCKDLLNDGDAWVWQQQLQQIYQRVLLQDLEYALDCKVEQELWNYGFKNYISLLQNMVKDRKSHKRSEAQALLTWYLEAASGFYLTLLQELCTAFDLDLSCRRKDSVYGFSENCSVVPMKVLQPNTTSCSYICQHCLVHLGDLARYRNQNRQAESFYRHAVQLSPTSGQPYNQLAILDSSRGDRLGTVFHYVRSITVRHFFPAASTNLKRMFCKFAGDHVKLEGRNKLNVQEYVALFLKLHGLLHLGGDYSTCGRFIRLLTDSLTAQVATENFTSRKLVQMLAINLFALHHARGKFILSETDKSGDHQDVPLHKLSPEQKQSIELILDLIAGSLSALLLPVYTIRDNEALCDYFALPAIKLILDWIQLEPHLLVDPAFTSRLQIWPSLCKLLNGLQAVLSESDCSDKFSSIPLPEDRELLGFLPLEKAFQNLSFLSEDVKVDTSDISQLRAWRLINFGVWLSKREKNSVISARESENCEGNAKFRKWTFEAIASGQAPSNELIRELEQLSLGAGQCPQQPSPSPSDAGSWGGSSTSTPGGTASPPPSVPLVTLEHVAQLPEKRTGILKPQGSLEKSRAKEMIEADEGSSDMGHTRKGVRQNVAMQTILRKGTNGSSETDTKQVSFKTPSPVTPECIEGSPRPWSDCWSKPAQPQPITLHKLPSTSPMFSEPPPPLQQLQQQAQARVVHVTPPFPLPPLSVPPPSLNINSMENPLCLASAGFGSPGGSSVCIQSSFPSWEEDHRIPPTLSESTSRSSPWWPAAPEQVPSYNTRLPVPRVPASPYSGSVSWGPIANAPSQVPPCQQLPYTLQSPQLQLPLQPQHQSHYSQQVHSRHGFQGMPSSPGLQRNFQQPPKTSPSNVKLSENTAAVEGFSPYSLFSTNSWLSPTISPGAPSHVSSERAAMDGKSNHIQGSNPSSAVIGAQSLWSGPGPSPLERLLEQQKQLREGPSPKSGT